MIFNVTGGGGGGTGGTLTVTAPAGVTVTVSKDGKTKTKIAGSDGIVVFKGLASGDWQVTITDGTQTARKTAVITTDYSVVIGFSTIPEFTYTGDFEIVNDNDEQIAVSQDNWKIRFLTSGTLVFTALNGAENGIDVFCVGGGGNGGTGYGGGGGGGYTTTGKAISVQAGQEYAIVVGGPTGETSGFGVSAAGGSSGVSNNKGGDGGSGGGSGFAKGGSDGRDGEKLGNYIAGSGQGTTTREFGEENGRLYAGGGGGGSTTSTAPGSGGDGGGGDGAYNKTGSDGQPNTGGGGGGGGSTASSGGSGIVVIRNAREVA